VEGYGIRPTDTPSGNHHQSRGLAYIANFGCAYKILHILWLWFVQFRKDSVGLNPENRMILEGSLPVEITTNAYITATLSVSDHE